MKVSFLHISKTGGAAMRQALAPFGRSHNLYFPGHEVTLKDVSVGEKVVFTVRDPVLRYVSAFNSRLRKGRPRNNMEWSPSERIAFGRFSSARSLAEALSAPSSARRNEAKQAMVQVYHVATFLSDWLGSVDYLQQRADDILFVANQPELDQDFDRLKRSLGLPLDLALPKDLIGSHRTPDGFDTMLSGLAVDNLQSWFARDLELYRACIELRAKILSRSGF